MVKIGVIGTGVIADEHLPAFKNIEDIQVTGVADIVEERAKKFAGEFDAKIFADYKELLKEDIEAVYILTPPNVHKEQVIDSINAGKHVFCEKPLAQNIEEAKAIVEAVESSDRKVAVGYVLHFFGALKTLEELFESGKLGELRQCWFKRYVKFCPKSHWVNDKNISGGMPVESFTHEIDWLASIGKSVKGVYADYQKFQEELRTEDTCTLIMHFEDSIGVGSSTWAASFRGIDAGIIGTKGTAVLKNNSEVVFKPQDGEEQVIKSDDLDLFKLENLEFIDCIQNNKTPKNTVEKALRAIEIAYAGYESSKNHSFVESF